MLATMITCLHYIDQSVLINKDNPEPLAWILSFEAGQKRQNVYFQMRSLQDFKLRIKSK